MACPKHNFKATIGGDIGREMRGVKLGLDVGVEFIVNSPEQCRAEVAAVGDVLIADCEVEHAARVVAQCNGKR
jgi:hypothetical protein